MSGREAPWDGPTTPATEAAKAAADHDRADYDHDDTTTKGERMKLETTMLGRAGNRRVILMDDDQRTYHGLPAATRAGRFRSPLAWAKAAARVAWHAVAGSSSDAERRRDGEDIDHGEAGPLETR
jgi:hypothetical protein